MKNVKSAMIGAIIAVVQLIVPVSTQAQEDSPNLKFSSLYPDYHADGDRYNQGYVELVNDGAGVEDINGFTMDFYQRTEHGSFEKFDSANVTDFWQPAQIPAGGKRQITPNCNDGQAIDPPNPIFICPMQYNMPYHDYVRLGGGAAVLLDKEGSVVDYCEWDSAVRGFVSECKPRSGGVYGNFSISNVIRQGEEGEFTADVYYKCPTYKTCDVTPNTYMIDRRKNGESAWVWDNSVPVKQNPELGQQVYLNEPVTSSPYDFVVTMFTDEGIKVVSNIVHLPAWDL